LAAPVTTLQQLYDNGRNTVTKFTFISGGTDQALTKVVDVTALQPPAGPHLKIRHIYYDINAQQGLVRLLWDAPPAPVDLLDLRGMDDQNFWRYGGLNSKGVLNATGSILVETQGFQLNESYSITLEMIKGV